MAVQEYKVNGYQFDNKPDYEQAVREMNTIANIKEKMNLSDAKVALSLYNQAVSKRTFKTPVGYAFLKNLRDTIIKSGLVEDSVLNPVPVVSEQNEVPDRGRMNSVSVSTKGTSGDKSSGRNNSRIKLLYDKEKKRRTALTIAVIALAGAIIGIFILTFKSKYSYLTYFTDYENNIREAVVNEYEEWQQQLQDKEKQLDEREQTLDEGKN